MDVITNYSDRYQSCVEAYDRCFQACRECSVLCLENPDAAGRKDCVDLLMRLARSCQEISYSISTESNPVREFTALCANLSDECKRCADVCRSM